MANKLYEENDIQSIANAIRGKNGTQNTYKVSQMANAITNLPSGANLQTKSITINQNGDTTVTPDTGYDGLDSVNITTNVSGGGSDDLKKVIDNTIVTLDIPDGVEVVAAYKFYNCNKMTSVTFPNTVTTIGLSAFYGCSLLTNVSLPASLTLIGATVFYSCSRLQEVILPDTVTSLGTSCFRNCYALTNVHIPTSISSIPSQCFQNCTSLTEIIIPNNITAFNTQCFMGCTNILKYDFTSYNSVPSLNNKNAFQSINANCKMVVPDSLYSTWIAATNWSNYANYIIKESDYNA